MSGAPGERVGRFELRGLLGRGGMGSVWRAHDPQLGRDVALKLIQADSRGRRAERLLVEGRAAAALRHPHVVRLHEVGEHRGQPYLVLDLVEGESLRARLEREGRLAPQAAVEVATALADALAAAHAQGIAHRDLKPENVLLAGGSWPLLTDFGLARREEEDRLTRTGELLGTPTYMSPEQIGGEKQLLGPACDVFALGVVLYELLTGRVPFAGTSLAALARAIASDSPPPPSRLAPGIDASLDALCAACLAKEPEARPSMPEVLRALRGWRAGGAQRGRPRELAAGVLVLLAAVAAVAALLAGSPAPDDRTVVAVAPATTAASGPAPEDPEAAGWPVWYRALPAAQRPHLRPRLRPAREPGLYTLALPDGGELELVWCPGTDAAPGVYLARYELGWGEYLAYLRHTGQRLPAQEGLGLRTLLTQPELPAVVKWTEARDFCLWAGGGRLPTLAEWRRAAARELPPPAGQLGSLEPSPARAGALGRSGLVGLADNLHEWVQDRLLDLPPALHARVRRHPNYQDAPQQNERLLAGGSFLTGPSLEALSTCPLHSYLADSGCRLALDAEPPPGPPLLLWQVLAIAFRPTPAETRTADHAPAGRSFEELLGVATRRLPLVLPHLDLPFGEGGPGGLAEAQGLADAAGFPDDWFALRATTRAELGAGRWRIVVREADDGVRVWLDGVAVIDLWRHGVWSGQAQPELAHAFQLDAPREVTLRVEHVEQFGAARLWVELVHEE